MRGNAHIKSLKCHNIILSSDIEDRFLLIETSIRKLLLEETIFIVEDYENTREFMRIFGNVKFTFQFNKELQ